MSLRIGVVGTGALGRHHARILGEMASVDLVAVADSNAESAQRVAAQCGAQACTDYHELLDAVDAVTIAVPTVAHLAVAGAFLNRGIPAMVEKPLAGSLQEARSLVETAERHRTLLQVGHVERFNPAVQCAMDLCGPPKYIRAERLSPYSFRSTDIGVVHDLMIHDIDLVLALVAAPLRRVQAFGICLMGGHEDSVQARLEFENGCIADLTASRMSPVPKRNMQIWSGLDCLTIDMAAREVVCYSPSESLLYGTPPVDRARQPGADIEQLKQDVFGKLVTIHKPDVPAGDALTAELSSFIQCVRTGSRPLVDGKQALLALEVADEVLQSVAAHQWDGHAAGPVGPHARRRQHEQRRMAG